MSESAQWFLDVQYYGEVGEVIPFTSYREARARCQELLAQVVHDCPSWVNSHPEVDFYAGLMPQGFQPVISGVELSDADGYRVSGAGTGGYTDVDELVDARLLEGLPFIVGKYRVHYLDPKEGTYTRVPGWFVEAAHG
jgi:hypothetical protein